MYPSHPSVAVYVARLQMEEDIKRAAAQSLAREVRRTARRRAREPGKVSRPAPKRWFATVLNAVTPRHAA